MNDSITTTRETGHLQADPNAVGDVIRLLGNEIRTVLEQISLAQERVQPVSSPTAVVVEDPKLEVQDIPDSVESPPHIDEPRSGDTSNEGLPISAIELGDSGSTFIQGEQSTAIEPTIEQPVQPAALHQEPESQTATPEAEGGVVLQLTGTDPVGGLQRFTAHSPALPGPSSVHQPGTTDISEAVAGPDKGSSVSSGLGNPNQDEPTTRDQVKEERRGIANQGQPRLYLVTSFNSPHQTEAAPAGSRVNVSYFDINPSLEFDGSNAQDSRQEALISILKAAAMGSVIGFLFVGLGYGVGRHFRDQQKHKPVVLQATKPSQQANHPTVLRTPVRKEITFGTAKELAELKRLTAGVRHPRSHFHQELLITYKKTLNTGLCSNLPRIKELENHVKTTRISTLPRIGRIWKQMVNAARSCKEPS